ncbi:YihY/virulence factor BrkB family protein [Actinoallomurus sp. CA-142502]|uniref:YihY/virulence factor BrkB family protein n=1 Tax=Actinoallomurus sp. CA-142502 TaxID=3239885 RepID=UPI003D8E1C2C
MTTLSDASAGVAEVSVRARIRSAVWRVVRGTSVSAFRYRVTGLAAEAAFFTLLSLPPLVLGLIGTLGHFRSMLGDDTVSDIRTWVIEKAQTVLTEQSVDTVVRPLLDDVLRGGRVEIVSLSFLVSLWAGSRALNVYVDTITIAYGLSGVRGVIRTRLRAFFLYIAGLGVGLVVIPLLVAGPTLVLRWLPEGARVLHVLYWPVLIVVSIVFLASLYYLSVPVRTAWWRGLPGGAVALAIWALGSLILRLYLDGSASGVSVYGSLGAAIAVLAWLYVTALAVLIGAALNAEIDKLWPGEYTARARAEVAEARARAAKKQLRAAERRVEAATTDEPEEPTAPEEDAEPQEPREPREPLEARESEREQARPESRSA